MGIRVELRRLTGEPVRAMGDPAAGTFDAAGDLDRVWPVADSSLALVQYVDPEGVHALQAD